MNRLGYSSLSDHQQKAVVEFVGGHDVLVVLPTGSGKSVCFASLPWLYTSIVMVVAPLNSIMMDQVSTFTKKGLSSVFVNAASVQDDPDLNRKLNEGMYQLVYIGPEMLIGQPIYRDMLMNPIYQKHLVAFVVDEAHCIKSRGTKFRGAFMRLGEIRSLMHPSLNVMALTATAVHLTKTVIRRTLGMSQNSCEIVASPIKKTSSLSYLRKLKA